MPCLPQRHLEREVDDGRALVNRARREDVHVRARVRFHVLLGQAAADLDEERAGRLALGRPLLLQPPRRVPHAVGGEVVQHDDVRAGSDGRVGLLDAAALDLDLGREPAGCLGGLHGHRDGRRDGLDRVCRAALIGAGPDVVVLEHGHRAEVVAVRVRAADEDAVLLHDAEAGRRLAGSREDAIPAARAEGLDQGCALGCDARAAGEDVQSHPFAEEDLPHGTSDCGTVLDGFDGLAFFDVPLDTGEG